MRNALSFQQMDACFEKAMRRAEDERDNMPPPSPGLHRRTVSLENGNDFVTLGVLSGGPLCHSNPKSSAPQPGKISFKNQEGRAVL